MVDSSGTIEMCNTLRDDNEKESLKMSENRQFILDIVRAASAHTKTPKCEGLLQQVLLKSLPSFGNLTFLRFEAEVLEQCPTSSTYAVEEENFPKTANVFFKFHLLGTAVSLGNHTIYRVNNMDY